MKRYILMIAALLFLADPAWAVHAEGVLTPCDKIRNVSRGAMCYTIFGHNPVIDTNTDPEEVWAGPTSRYNWPTAAGTWYISSSEAADDQLLLVQGLNADWEIQQVVGTLSGNTFVALPGTWIRFWTSFNIDTTEVTGDIYISSDNTDAGGDGIPDTLTTVHGFYSAGEQITEQTPWTSPIDHACHVVASAPSLASGVGVARVVDLYIRVRRVPTGILSTARHGSLSSAATSSENELLPFPTILPPKMDISVEAYTTANGADVSVSYTVACLRCNDCNP